MIQVTAPSDGKTEPMHEFYVTQRVVCNATLKVSTRSEDHAKELAGSTVQDLIGNSEITVAEIETTNCYRME